MHARTRLLAARSGQLLARQTLGRELALPTSTTHRYLNLLEEVYLIKRVPAWSRNLSNRAVSTAKVAFADSGIAANLLSVDAGIVLHTGTQTLPFGDRMRARPVSTLWEVG
ncbi:DUF4143 domain-containing protein [Nonomuraea sp. 3N208]|uniref:DUF4143 domain-containing protein n=1 Tax=Nonomuraea sp. 3N208 TaxID=3457421 RepID=UPI003FCD0BEB